MMIVCGHCGAEADLPTGHVNRSRRLGMRLYCGRECSALGRRRLTSEQRKARKAEYDRRRRDTLGDTIRAAKREAYLRNRSAHLAKQAQLRASPEYRARMKAYQHAHVRKPAVRAAKKAYDRVRRARLEFGDSDLADAAVALWELVEMLRPSGHDNKAKIGRINLCQTRRRKSHAPR